MDSKLTIREQTAEFDDWIGRFIGYLSEYEYLHKNDSVGIEYVWNGETKADNIVYIYGATRGGKNKYMNYLSEELNKRSEYVCCGHLLQHTADTVASLDFQKKLAESFQKDKKRPFLFPCLHLLEEAEQHKTHNALWTALSEIFDVSYDMAEDMEKVIAGNIVQQILSAGAVARQIFQSKEFVKNFAAEESGELKKLRAEFKKCMRSGQVGTMISEENPFECLRLDLHLNTKRDKHRVICMIDGFELCNVNNHSQKNQKTDPKAYLLKMMASVPEVVWVLFSRTTPDDGVRKVIKRENCWRMGGISRERTMGYLKEMCPGAPTNWREAVYRHTGGYLGLMELCVKAYSDEKKRYEDSPIVRYEKKLKEAIEVGDEDEIEFYQNKLSKLKKTTEGASAEDKRGNTDDKYAYSDDKIRQMEQQYLDIWFKKVWNDGPWTPDLTQPDVERDQPLDFLFGSGRMDFLREPEDSEKKYFLPCLCYLAKLSMYDVGTIEQYCWNRMSASYRLNGLGNRCVRLVEADPSFCKEYEEYPGMLYLDPVIVRVIREHECFGEWCAAFEEACVTEIGQAIDKVSDLDIKAQAGENDVTHSAGGNAQNVKMAESNASGRNAELVQEVVAAAKAPMPKSAYEMSNEEEESQGEAAAESGEGTRQSPQNENRIHGSYNPENAGSEVGTGGGKSEADKKHVEDTVPAEVKKVIDIPESDINDAIDE